ncbi:MAG: GSU2086 family protein [Candidatus Krumholzibacteriia bacterium]
MASAGNEGPGGDLPLRGWPEVGLDGVRRLPFQARLNKVSVDDFGRPGAPGDGGGAWNRWLDRLPRLLAADNLRLLVSRLREARRDRRVILWLLGGHVVKTGLAPYLIDLMDRGYLTAVAMNGSASIHDVETALFGRTSEDVARNLEDGSFGMVAETGDFFFAAYRAARADGCGMGEGVARQLERAAAPHRDRSLLHGAWRRGIPCTVHVAVGTDIIHQQPGADGAAIGELTMHDFRVLAEVARGLEPVGVVVNLGSAVVMPEVFLKAYTVARNLGCRPRQLTTANLDMVQHYRPRENVLQRPAAFGGAAIPLTGHHEIMVPLLHALLLDADDADSGAAADRGEGRA